MAKSVITVVKSNKHEVTISRDESIVIIGERINPTGRSALQKELKAGKFDIVRRDAVAQLEAGASILDINSGLPRADEPALMVQMIKEVQDAADDPVICLDTANVKALEAGLKYYCKDGAKPMINSVTAEGKSLKAVLPLVKEYGAVIIGLCSGDDGIPKTAEKRLKNTDTLIEAALKMGIPIENIVIDCLILTLGVSGEAALEAMNAIDMIVEKYGVNITMGASNISFGLPAREQLTSFFMAMSAVKGLTCPICNPLKKQEVIAMNAANICLGKKKGVMNWIKTSRALGID